ncbi:RagB/SusD family nutrient uptake outer membrane protein [Parapedobacter koreensis]|uniref:RagB/SusD domain-containing protein n=1 Tax=Parapedobacter koreensis TaxID=332977 RepID=A0A1H7THE4_9SPHI|nr:RagB/SusD family nutrient uptake outer membrane protein [Parapedobacter koreensis]SEL84241.1 RagB/SusD domain-containing protein [Parapedobacter koreensis]
MKTVNCFILTLVIASFFSCSKLLEEDVRSQITDNHLGTAGGWLEGVNASYSFLRSFYGIDENGATVTVFGTDEFTNGFDGGLKSFNFYDFGLNPRNGVVNSLWNNLYIAINTCNAVISRAPEVTGLADDLKDIRLAEVRFLRAQYYFLLVQLFGPVHLTLEEVQGVQTAATRAPVGDIYAAIIADLAFALERLPAVASDYGRATKPATEHLLAKVYLTKASTAAQQPDDYANAANYASSVIDNYNFGLLDDFADVFEQGEGEKNAEVIWSIQNSKNFITAGQTACCDGGNTLHTYFLMKYDDLPGMQRDIENGRPWARFRPTRFTLEQLFDRTLDDRYDKSFKRVFYANRPGTYTINGRQVTLNTGDTAVFVSDREWSAAELSRVNYNVFPPSRQNERVYPTLTKFLDPDRPDPQEMRGSRDFIVFRLAETYLLAAEALVMDNKPEEAVAYVNAVRRRAAKKGNTPDETLANQLEMEVRADQVDIDFILDERARELLGEMMRWLDLVRTGKLVERVRMYNPDAANNIQPFHALRPIPQDQIDRTDTEFPQNEGYQ